MPPTQIITFVIGSIVVIFGAYLTTYLVARGSQRVYKGRAIQVLDRFSLSKDKSLMLIAVYDRIYLVAFAAGSVTLLDNIEPQTAAAFAASLSLPEDKNLQPLRLATMLFSRLRRQPAKKEGGAKIEHSIPFETYLDEGRRSAFGDHGSLEEDNRP